VVVVRLLLERKQPSTREWQILLGEKESEHVSHARNGWFRGVVHAWLTGEVECDRWPAFDVSGLVLHLN
jgi:hypothetical protein